MAERGEFFHEQSADKEHVYIPFMAKLCEAENMKPRGSNRTYFRAR